MNRESITLDLSRAGVGQESLRRYDLGIQEGESKLHSGEVDFTGWVKLPQEYDRQELLRIKETAAQIRSQCEAFIVIGIGGSYLGARAAVEMLGHSFAHECRRGAEPSDCAASGSTDCAAPKVYFAGQNISGTYHAELLEIIKDQETAICIISKSGTTTEPSIAFALLKDALYQKYGREEANRRIYAITDRDKGTLREEVEREGYMSFVVPDDIGGRYSVLTPVGLLPIAAAGIDIDEMLAGAGDSGSVGGACHSYAAVRNALAEKGKLIEVFECYEPKLQYFTEWLKQLFGESEGKDGQGIFPAALQFSSDLHSMGQFLQEGNQIFFETVLNVTKPEKDIIVPESAGGLLAGKSMNEVNQAAVEGVMAAHVAAGVPILKLDIPELTPYYFGQMVYFFEKTCALSGYLSGVDPFNQPGVEQYKTEMRKALQK